MKKHELSSDELHKALMGEDELGVVLRAHFYVEAAVEKLITVMVRHPRQLPKLRYEQKAKLACAIGLDVSVFQPLKELGDLRNSFGHQIGAKITLGGARKLYDSFSLNDKNLIEQGYKLTQRQMGSLPDIRKLGPKDLFVLSVIALYKVIIECIIDVQNKPL
jgi:hypothetical protein